jgi:predicted nuclease of predicted toxin-antitoxin system
LKPKLREPTQHEILGDENINSTILAFLGSLGLDAKDLANYGLLGKSDLEILTVAQQEERCIITQDADFGKLVFADTKKLHGIIYVRPGHIAPYFHINTLQAILNETLDCVPPFILVAENKGDTIKIRLRNSIR